MAPETFLRVLGPKPYSVAYVQPSRRPADGRYGENPNRLYKHQQLQVILKPSPADVHGAVPGRASKRSASTSRKHDIKFEEDNWEVADARRVGHRLAGDAGRPRDHAVHLLPAVRRRRSGAGSGRADLRPGTHRRVPAGRRERLRHRVGARRSATAMCGSPKSCSSRSTTSRWPTSRRLWQLFDLHEAEAQRLLDVYADYPDKQRFPVLAAYDHVLKCSHLFNLLDSRGRHQRDRARRRDRARAQARGRRRRLLDGPAGAGAEPQATAEVAQ